MIVESEECGLVFFCFVLWLGRLGKSSEEVSKLMICRGDLTRDVRGPRLRSTVEVLSRLPMSAER